MKIPFYTSRKELATLRTKNLKAETRLIRERTSAIKQQNKQSKEAMKAIMDMANKPVMSLNSELYGTSSLYSNDLWSTENKNVRRVARIAYNQSPAAQAMIGRFTDLVYGPKLELQSAPMFDLIPNSPTDPESQQQIIKNIEMRWKLFAKSKNSDYELDKSHFEQSRNNFEKLLIDGEYFLILRYAQTRKRNPLSVQYIKPENIMRVDSQVSTGNIEVDGIEYNSKGQAVAYHVYDPTTSKSTRVLKYGPKSGRTFVIHNKIGGGRRGVSILSGIITELTKLSDFQALEIQAAVINSMFAIWVETPIGGEDKDFVNKNGIGGINTQKEQRRNPFSASEYEAKLNSTDYDHGGLVVSHMGEGQKLNSFDTKRPTANFEQFFNAVKRNLYSARGMSIAVADYNFNGSYSAARGELLVFWNRIITFRQDHAINREDEIFRMWLWGEIDNGNVTDFGYNDEFIREAFSNATWTGPTRPDIDPEKSAKAHMIESENGWKTDSIITAERGGGDFDENIIRKEIENVKKAKVNEPLIILEKTSYSNSKNITESKSVSITEGA